MLGDVVAISTNSPPTTRRSILKPSSFTERSCHAGFIRVAETAAAVRLRGIAGTVVLTFSKIAGFEVPVIVAAPAALIECLDSVLVRRLGGELAVRVLGAVRNDSCDLGEIIPSARRSMRNPLSLTA